MRTTMELADELMREVKRRAADEGSSVRSIVERALRAHLGGPLRRPRYRLSWRTEKGRLQPGVTIEDRDALFDLMDGRR